RTTAEPYREVNHRHHAAPEIKHAFDVLRRHGHGGEVGVLDDLPHPLDAHRKGLLEEREPQVLLTPNGRGLRPAYFDQAAHRLLLEALVAVDAGRGPQRTGAARFARQRWPQAAAALSRFYLAASGGELEEAHQLLQLLGLGAQLLGRGRQLLRG